MKKLIVKGLIENPTFFEGQVRSARLLFEPAIWQHERVYVPRDYRAGTNAPRLVMRTEILTTEEPARYYMYLKRHIEDSGVDIVNLTAVGDYTEASAIIHQLGFKKLAEVSRKRQELQLDARTVIYRDTIEGLDGEFLKLEFILDDDASVEAARRELFTTLKLFGQKTFLLQTYADLLNTQMQPYFVPE